MGGSPPAANRVFIAADPDNAHFVSSLEREFLFSLGHERHHCLRWSAVGYGDTLDEALVTEGLACHFETELRSGARAGRHPAPTDKGENGPLQRRLRPRSLVFWDRQHTSLRRLYVGIRVGLELH